MDQNLGAECSSGAHGPSVEEAEANSLEKLENIGLLWWMLENIGLLWRMLENVGLGSKPDLKMVLWQIEHKKPGCFGPLLGAGPSSAGDP